jgi:small-conductance mechanosensitive channel
MNQSDSLGGQAQRLWADVTAWLSSHYIQILLGLIAGAVIVAVLLGVRWIGTRICGTDPTHTHWRTVIGRVLAGTRLWFMIAVAARLVASYSLAPEIVAATVAVFFTLALTLQVALWVRELVLGVIEHRAGGLDASSGLGSAIGIIRLLVSVALFAIAIIVILDNLGVNVTGLVAGLGIGGIAIGLAAQGIFSDLFAALSIIFDKPFRRGDSIRWDTTTGTVEQIGLKTTRVRSLTGEEVVISNTNLLDFSFEFDVKSEVWQKVFEARHQVLVALLKRFNDEKIEFAYPTQVGFTAAPDGTLIMPYPPEETSTKATETR